MDNISISGDYEVIYDDVTVSVNGEVCAIRSTVVGLRRVDESEST